MIDGGELAEVISEFLVKSPYNARQYEPRDFIVWHTHPGGLVGPSKGDMEQKRQAPDFRYIVVTWNDEQHLATEY